MKSEKAGDWGKTQYSNLIRYVPSGTYFARIRVRGKLLRKSLKTDVLSVAKLRLTDLKKAERQTAENNSSAARGKMTFGQAVTIFQQRIEGDASLKPRSKSYHFERIKALLKSWTELEKTDIRAITKSDCLNWLRILASRD